MQRILSIILVAAVLLVAPPLMAKIDNREFASSRKECKKAIKRGDWSTVAACVEKVATDDSARMVKLYLLVMKRTDVPARVIDAVVDGLAGIKSDEAMDELEKRLKSKAWKARIVIVLACEKMTSPGADALLIKFLTDKKGEVARAAIAAVIKRDDVEFIEPLINALEKVESERGSVWAEIRLALLKISRGEDFETAGEWRKFWSYGRKSVEKDREGKPEPPPTPGSIKTSSKKKTPKFFGTEIMSKRIVFVIDVSGSMINKDGDEPRITKVKRELIGAVKKLEKKALFNIIPFGADATPWQKKMVEATKKTKAAAEKFVNTMPMGAFTNTYAGLNKAFGDEEVDTIFLLSDGAPTMGKDGRRPKTGENNSVRHMAEVLEFLKNANRLRRIRIFTFGFKSMERSREQKCLKFLKMIAKENGGTYKSVE